MKTVFGIALVLLLATFIACEKDNQGDNPYPVWIIYTHVFEESDIGIPNSPVRGCAQIIFHVLPSMPDSTVPCEQGSNLVKAWNHIDSVITVEYYVHCANYYDSAPMQHTFRADRAIQRPGRDGPEDIAIDTVVLVGL